MLHGSNYFENKTRLFHTVPKTSYFAQTKKEEEEL